MYRESLSPIEQEALDKHLAIDFDQEHEVTVVNRRKVEAKARVLGAAVLSLAELIEDKPTLGQKVSRSISRATYPAIISSPRGFTFDRAPVMENGREITIERYLSLYQRKANLIATLSFRTYEQSPAIKGFTRTVSNLYARAIVPVFLNRRDTTTLVLANEEVRDEKPAMWSETVMSPTHPAWEEMSTVIELAKYSLQNS